MRGRAQGSKLQVGRVQSSPASLVMRSWRSCSVALMRALKLVITAMLVASRSISSSIFRKSFFIFRMVSRRVSAKREIQKWPRQKGAALTDTSDLPEMAWVLATACMSKRIMMVQQALLTSIPDAKGRPLKIGGKMLINKLNN